MNVEMGNLPDGWRLMRLEEVCQKITDGTHKTPNYQPTGVRFISIKNIRPFQPINWKSYEKYITPAEHHDLTKRCKPEYDDILFPRIGTLGFAKRIDFHDEVSIFVGLGLLKPRKEIVRPKFLELWMNSPLIHRLSHERANGSGRLTLSLEESRLFPVLVPPLSEQDAIVSEVEKQFTRREAGVAGLRRVQANLKRYRAAVLKAACEGKLVPTEAELARQEGRTYETGAQLLERILTERRQKWNGKGKYKEPTKPDLTNLPGLPEGWAWARLDAVAALKGGITVDRNRRSSTARNVPYLRVANVQRGYLDLSEIKEIAVPEKDIADLRLLPGDILFTEGGDRDKLGRGWIWQGQIVECIHQNHIFRARLCSAEIESKFVSWWGNSFGQIHFLREGKQTTNLASINLSKLSQFPIPIPPPAERHRIVAEVERRLSVLEEIEAVVNANLQRATRLRQSILQQAFEGKLHFSECLERSYFLAL